jgi:predicted nuclease of restriction endonuclease-like (RecB) superfamily
MCAYNVMYIHTYIHAQFYITASFTKEAMKVIWAKAQSLHTGVEICKQRVFMKPFMYKLQPDFTTVQTLPSFDC